MRKEEWAKHVEAQASSGKSIAEYCREHGLKESALQYHRNGHGQKFLQVGGRAVVELTLPDGAILRFPSSEVAVVLKALRGA
jgi:hypothetical protein